MLKRPRLALTTLAAAAGVAALSTAAPAAASAVGPQQYFVGSVNSHTAGAVIDVLCPGPTASGHPLGNQSVAVALLLPPTSTTVGYTGLSATSVNAWLSWPTPVAPPSPVHIATFTSYGTAPIPTDITVPCSGTAVMTFVPGPDNGGRASTVDVTFVNLGV